MIWLTVVEFIKFEQIKISLNEWISIREKNPDDQYGLLSRAWNAFRNVERDDEGCEDVEKYCLKFCRFCMGIGLVVGITVKGVTSILIPLLLASQLKTEKVLNNYYCWPIQI